MTPAQDKYPNIKSFQLQITHLVRSTDGIFHCAPWGRHALARVAGQAEALGVVWRGNSTAREHRSELLTREEARNRGVGVGFGWF